MCISWTNIICNEIDLTAISWMKIERLFLCIVDVNFYSFILCFFSFCRARFFRSVFNATFLSLCFYSNSFDSINFIVCNRMLPMHEKHCEYAYTFKRMLRQCDNAFQNKRNVALYLCYSSVIGGSKDISTECDCIYE